MEDRPKPARHRPRVSSQAEARPSPSACLSAKNIEENTYFVKWRFRGIFQLLRSRSWVGTLFYGLLECRLRAEETWR